MSNINLVETIIRQKLTDWKYTFQPEDWLLFQESLVDLTAEEQIRQHFEFLQPKLSPQDWAEMEQLLTEKLFQHQLNTYQFNELESDWDSFSEKLPTLNFDKTIEDKLNHHQFDDADWADFQTYQSDKLLSQKIDNHIDKSKPDWAEFSQHLTENDFKQKLESFELKEPNDWDLFEKKYFAAPITDAFLKEKLASLAFSPKAGDWEAMEKLLDERKRRGGAFWWKKPGLVVLGLLVGTWLWNQYGKNEVEEIHKEVKPLPNQQEVTPVLPENKDVSPTKVIPQENAPINNHGAKEVEDKHINITDNQSIEKKVLAEKSSNFSTKSETFVPKWVDKSNLPQVKIINPPLEKSLVSLSQNTEKQEVSAPKTAQISTQLPQIVVEKQNVPPQLEKISGNIDSKANHSANKPILSNPLTIEKLAQRNMTLETPTWAVNSNNLAQEQARCPMKLQGFQVGLYGASLWSVAELKDRPYIGGAVGIRTEAAFGKKLSIVNGLIWGQKNIQTYYYKYSSRLGGFYQHKLIGATRELGFVFNVKYRQPLNKNWSLYSQAGIMPFISLREDYQHFDPTTIYNYAAKGDFSKMTPEAQTQQFRTYWGYAQFLPGIQYKHKNITFYAEPFFQWNLDKLSTEQKRIHSYGVGGGIMYKIK